MALKFLNKKGWHTGSLRNIENVWKAEQKHDAEQKKLDELRKQIQEEKERNEFRLLQEQAGLVPRQERLDFLYDSGLATGKSDGASASAGASGSGSGFKALEQPSSATGAAAGTAGKEQSSVPGALFEDKPYSASDAWRKLHSDPLLLIRQREQEALARVKNNPVKMALIHKLVEKKKDKTKKKHKEKSGDKKERKKKHRSCSEHQKHSGLEYSSSSEGERPRKDRDYKSSLHEEHCHNKQSKSRDELSKRRDHKNDRYKNSKYRENSPSGFSESRKTKVNDRDSVKRNHERSKHEKYPSEDRTNYDVRDSMKRNHDRAKHHEKYPSEDRTNNDDGKRSSYGSAAAANRGDSHYKRRPAAPKISEEERAARLREMQENAEMHEEQRWKRIKKAEEDDAREATRDGVVSGKNFLDAAQKSVYGAEQGGSSTIEERVRRRTYYSQGREASEGHAFRR